MPHYERFLAAFPTPAACARAGAAAVVRQWSGLGYNRRALSLHRMAIAVVDEHAGVVPDDDAALRRLPGVGPYTARAVRSFAYGQDVAAVDTNALRLLSRCVAGAPLGSSRGGSPRGPPRPAGRVLGVQPGRVRSRCDGLHRRPAALRCLPAPAAVPLAPCRSSRARPVAGPAGGEDPGHLRRVGSPRPRPSVGGAAPGHDLGGRARPGVRLAGRSGPRRPDGGGTRRRGVRALVTRTLEPGLTAPGRPVGAQPAVTAPPPPPRRGGDPYEIGGECENVATRLKGTKHW